MPDTKEAFKIDSYLVSPWQIRDQYYNFVISGRSSSQKGFPVRRESIYCLIRFQKTKRHRDEGRRGQPGASLRPDRLAEQGSGSAFVSTGFKFRHFNIT
jgi:hypothetical protein